MTLGYIKQMALEVIMEQQANTKIDADKDRLSYLLGFNDGVIELTSRLSQVENETESEVSNADSD